LYAALADQARVHSLPGANGDVGSFRAIAADYMLAHADDFAPFLDNPDDCTDMNALLRQYADKVRSTVEWGGQLELRALAAALQCVIVVHSAAQAPLRMGDDVAGAPELHVSYHKRLLSLGAHYNSVRPIQ
jgi:OTU domain-containing protein 6